jgi:alpha-glucosidase
MKIKIKSVVFALLAQAVLILDSFAGHTLSISMHNGEKWWGGANSHGSKMPFDKNTSLAIDLCKDGGANQYASLLLSDRGRAIWCDSQTTIAFDKGKITVKSASAKVEMIDAAGNLRDAFRKASAAWFPTSGKTPDLLFFSAPQYNTWIELTYNQNENDILRYAQSI